METLNEARLAIVLHQHLRDGRVLGPVEANHKEPVFLEFRRTVPIKLGVRLGELIYTSEDLNLAMKNNHKPFLIGVKRGSVCVCLGPDASVCDEIRAVCQAVCLRTVLHPVSPLEGALKQLSMSHSNNHWELVHESHKLMDQIFQPFLKGVTCQDAPDWGHGTSGRVRGAGTGRTGLGKRTSWESARRRHMMYRTGEARSVEPVQVAPDC
ncbi:RUS family member 1-like [Oncorhynchus clarkii lewisi]|uniref:RUS family member 1-like n=1 Tax=Oncorhynchus clarkii lewisi TaxID=490388 RepID=UPI0039B94AAF